MKQEEPLMEHRERGEPDFFRLSVSDNLSTSYSRQKVRRYITAQMPLNCQKIYKVTQKLNFGLQEKKEKKKIKLIAFALFYR